MSLRLQIFKPFSALSALINIFANTLRYQQSYLAFSSFRYFTNSLLTPVGQLPLIYVKYKNAINNKGDLFWYAYS